MKRYFTIVAIIIFSVSSVFAQDPDTSGVYFDDEYTGKDIPLHNNNPLQKNNFFKPHWHLSLGSSFGYMPGYGNTTGFYAAPSLSFPVNKRLAVHAAVVASGMMHPGMNSFGENNRFGGFQSLTLHGSASYMLNENLMIYGSGTKVLNDLPVMHPFMPYPANSFSIGSSFKIGENITIGASFSTSDRYNYYGPFTPFGGGNFGGFGGGMYPPFGY